MFQNSTKVETTPTNPSKRSVITKAPPPKKRVVQKKPPYLGKPVKSPPLPDLIEEKDLIDENDAEAYQTPKKASLLPDPNSDLLDYNPLDPKRPKGQKTPVRDSNSARKIIDARKMIDGRQRQMSP